MMKEILMSLQYIVRLRTRHFNSYLKNAYLENHHSQRENHTAVPTVYSALLISRLYGHQNLQTKLNNLDFVSDRPLQTTLT